MAFTLSLVTPPDQSNDAKTLTLTDGSTGWITDQALPTTLGNYLTFDISIRTYDSTTDYDTIAYHGPYSTANELIFPITCAKLLFEGTAMGTSDDVLPDGLYDIVYTLYNNSGVLQSSYNVTLVIMGQIKIDIANDFADVPNNWTRTEMSLLSDEILTLIQPLYKEANYAAIVENPYQADETKMLNIIDLLTSLIND